MRAFHRPRLWLSVWIFGWCLCIALSLLPPLPVDGPQGSDKWGHCLAYFLLSAWAMQLFAGRRAQGAAALSLLALGLAMEVGQAQLTTTRLGDPLDMLANAFGVALGLLAAAGAGRGGLLQRVDARLFAKA